ncbi:adenylate/guanylate cyclase domain-containing protein [Alteromonas sp. CYL-A6]|uniref:adenylate/guanylate cyclase domain-containing protein n=1 Tax=Alteromonas nitratireducens TaxID=3390813 RepID=UPI0034C0AC45
MTVLWYRQRRLHLLTLEQTVPLALRPADDVTDKSRRIQERADEAIRLSQTFQKFVPRQFVEHFAKHGSRTLELGHADEDEVAILFCDIRGFTGLSERMQPHELMKFLNSYFLRMNDPIHNNQGFIDKFIGDAIMALFDHPDGDAGDKATDAVNAALDLRSALTTYNSHRAKSGYPAINVGIGIHFGPVILGTVGSDDRMDTTVIGDSVNIACRLEALAPVYGADIVISAQVLETIGNKRTLHTRLIDWVRIKGRTAPLEIYEVLDHLSDDARRARLATGSLIRQGVHSRMGQRWEEAMAHFARAQTLAPDDPVIAYHLKVCDQYRFQDIAENWDGALPPVLQ